ncbi:hypothetical protein HY251_18225, partial [bacterium]|nr:hypothetical protein [bacterium]
MSEEPPVKERKASSVGGVAVALLVAGGAGLGYLATRPQATNRGEGGAQTLEKARARLAAGDRTGSAGLLARVAQEGTLTGESAPAREARDLLAKLASDAVLPGRPLAEAAEILPFAVEAARPGEEALVSSQAFILALDRASSEAQKDPNGACALTQSVAVFLEGSPLQEKLREARRVALEAKLALEPGDILSKISLAELELNRGDFARARERLEPLASQLGDGEGARVLGLARAAAGARDDAIPLLSSYLAAHMNEYARAKTGFQAAVESAEASARADLRAGRVDPAFKRKHEALRQRVDAATGEEQKRLEAERTALVRGYMDDRISRDPAVRGARRAIVGIAGLVRVAYQLALMEVDAARGKPEAQREAALRSAESRFIAVVDVGPVIESTFGLALGRLELQLGKSDDAQAAFELFLRRQESTSPALLAVATAFLDAGVTGDARKHAEEAFEAATTEDDRERAAVLRSHLGETREDQLAWIARAGSSPPLLALASRVRAEQATDEGRFEEACREWDRVLAFYEGEGARLVPISLIASIRFARFMASGARGDLDAAISGLEKAAVLDGPDGPPLGLQDELADQLLARAVLVAIGPRLKIDVLREPSLELIEAAAKDPADLLAIREAFLASPDRKRSCELRERVLRSDPSRALALHGLVAEARARRDASALAALAVRIDAAPLERALTARRTREAWLEKDSPGARRGQDRRRARADAVVAQARALGEAPTLARALTARAQIEREAAGVGSPCDLSLDVSLCVEAERVFPNRTSRLALVAAYFAKTAYSMKKDDPALEALLKEHGGLGSVKLLALLAPRDEKLAKALADDIKIKFAVEIHRLVLADEGDDLGTHDWLVPVA